jgi:probable rRNA maturation factor
MKLKIQLSCSLSAIFFYDIIAHVEINVLIDKEYKKQVKSIWLKNLARQIQIAENVNARSEMGLVITGDDEIHQLNLKYLDEDRPTDVLSFPMNEQIDAAPVFVKVPDGKIHLGEIIISYPQAVKQAEEHQHSVEREIIILLIHGILHLLGYDHDIPEREQKMHNRELAILKTIEESGL